MGLERNIGCSTQKRFRSWGHQFATVPGKYLASPERSVLGAEARASRASVRRKMLSNPLGCALSRPSGRFDAIPLLAVGVGRQLGFEGREGCSEAEEELPG